jgi:hypothetical protein
MRHRLAMNGVAVQPNAAVEGETQPFAAAREFTGCRGGRYWQTM